MLQIFMYTLPTLLLIIGGYLFFYRKMLVDLFQLTQPKYISMFSLAFVSMSFLGYLLVALNSEILLIIWIIVALILTSILSTCVYFSLK